MNQPPSPTRSHSDTRRSHVSVLVTYSYAHFSNDPVIFYYFVVRYLVVAEYFYYFYFFTTLQNYNISWTCPGCYSQRSDSKVSLKDTTTHVPNLERDQTYSFNVYANTIFGPGEISTTTATISRYFGQVQKLRQNFENYTLTLQWDKPSDVEAKDIKVPCAIYSLARNVYVFIVFVLSASC